jgi:hypothetical protein
MDSLEKSYFEIRIFDELQISKEENSVEVREFDAEMFTHKDKKVKSPIFTEDKDGNIDILVYTLDRKTIHYDNKNATPDKPNINNARVETYQLKRYKPGNEPKDKNGEPIKYQIPKGQGTYPFFHPNLLKKFEKKTKIENLILTEGYFKAFKAAKHGFDCVGLSSIHHGINKRTGSLHADIISLIEVCKPTNVYILFDGDARHLSNNWAEKETDLHKRPNSFFTAAQNIATSLKELKDTDFNIFYSQLKSDDIPENPKGLDDLLVQYKENPEAVLKDFLSSQNITTFFEKLNITNNISRLEKWFNLKSAETFYKFYQEQIGSLAFIWNGTKYAWDEQKNEIRVLMPAEAKNYMRVGTDYYKVVGVPSKNGVLQRQIRLWSKSTITDDHGKRFIDHVPKYDAFCTVPQHINYQQVKDNCYNKYFPFEHEAFDGDEPIRSLRFIKHIFGEQYELGLDYIQLLYQKPIQILPILCLVSHERQTGKSTFVNWLNRIFRNNCLFVSNEDLGNAFNSPFQGKLLVFIEETLIEKQATLEKIKNLSTAHESLMNAKGKEQINMDVFLKFIFCANNEESFIYVEEEEIRFWVRKVKSISKDEFNTNLLEDLTDEIPLFLNFLNKRKMSTNNVSRMWFDEKLLITDAFKKVVANSKPAAERAIRHKLKEMFIEFNLPTLEMTCTDIIQNLLAGKFKGDERYISKILTERLNMIPPKTAIRYVLPYKTIFNDEEKISWIKKVGRAYTFHREDFLTADEIKALSETEQETPPPAEIKQNEIDFKTNEGEEMPF